MTEAIISDLRQLGVAVRYQVQSYLRTYRFLALVILTILIVTILFVVLYEVVTPTTVVANNQGPANFLDSSIGFVSDLVFLSAALLGGDAISTDFGARTGYYTLVLPIRRRVLLLGRYLGAWASACAIVVVYYVGESLTTAYFFGGLPGAALVGSLGLAFLYCAAAVALAFFFSSVVKTPAFSIVLTFVLLFIALPIIDTVIALSSNVEPWFSLSYAGGILQLPFVNHPHTTGGVAFTSYFPTLGEGMAIMGAYLAVGLVLAAIIYEFKESSG